MSVELNITGTDPATPGKSAEDSTDHGCFSTSTLSYNTDDLTLLHGKIEMLNGRCLLSVLNGKILDFKHK
jgi:hypothetical protein